MSITKLQVFEARNAVGQTQKEAAAVLGVHWRTWQAWEIGVNPMPVTSYRLYRHLTGIRKIPFKSRI